MATVNKQLENLTLEDIHKISIEYLMGWHDLMKYGFRIKGFNKKRQSFGLEPLTKDMSFDYRIQYVKSSYTYDEIVTKIRDYLSTVRVGDARWQGIELFDCRFGREYARAFKVLMGSHEYRKLSEELRNQKSMETQTALYGGMGLAGIETYEKAVQTMVDAYGVTNPMLNEQVRQKVFNTNQNKYGGNSPFCSKIVQDKSSNTHIQNIVKAMQLYKQTGEVTDAIFRQSPHEFEVMSMLLSRFGVNDVYYKYGIHPYDARYPYHCDFYVKSLDLFVELNAHYSHHTHWFDDSCHDDMLRLQHLLSSGSKRSINAANVWSKIDVEKRQTAKDANLKYLVFWDGSMCQIHKEKVPKLSDFKRWFYEYNCDYESFIKDFPENTY